MTALFFVLWIASVSAFGGSAALGRLGFKFNSRLESASFGLCFGMGTLGLVIFTLGCLGLYRPAAFYILFSILSIPLIAALPHLIRESAAPAVRSFSGNPILWVAAAVFALAAVQCMIPATAHDALAYQLDVPKRFALAGKVHYIPYGVNSVFPLLMNMFYVAALLLDGTRLAHLLHLLTAAGITAGLLSLERSYIKRSWLGAGGLVFLLTPGIFNQMTIAYNDIALSFFGFYAFYAVIKAGENPSLRWFVLAGIFLGFALGVKYLAGLGAISIAVYLGYRFLRGSLAFKTLAAGLLWMGLVAFVVGAVWYLRSYIYEGSVLYFGEEGYAPRGAKTLSWLALPWMMTVRPELFGGSWARLGFLYLSFLPWIFFIRSRPKVLNAGLWFSCVYFALWLFLPRQNLRFLFPVLGFWALAVAYVAGPGTGPVKWLQRIVRPVFFAVLIFEFASAVYHGRAGYRAALGLESEAQYLSRVERSYPPAQFINRTLDGGAKILNAYEVRMFYFDRALVREPEFRAKTHYDTRFARPDAMIDFLKGEGFTHVLAVLPPLEPGSSAESPFHELARRLDSAPGRAREIYRQSPPAAPRMTYVLYELIGGRS